MGGTLNCYFDISSFYSYLALHYLIQNRLLLEAHGVEVNINPVYNAELLKHTGNRPPWIVSKKQEWFEQWEIIRAKSAFGKPNIEIPGGSLCNLLKVGMTEAPMRALLYIKRTYPRDTFETTFHHLFAAFWEPPQRVVKESDVLRAVLAEVPRDYAEDNKATGTTERLFTGEEVDTIMKGSAQEEYGADLVGDTHTISEKGAFGVPWFFARTDDGKEEPFFGSDRFGHIYGFLGVPFQDVAILQKT